MKKSFWKNEVVSSIKELGGEATLKDIYQRIEDRAIIPLNDKWESEVVKTLNYYSSDSILFNNKEDIFYYIEEKDILFWGLRDFDKDIKLGNLTEDDLSFPEGKKKLKSHIVRERNPRVIREAKKIFKSKNKKLYCEVCGFNFEEVYGEIGRDYIEGHHSVPVSELNDGDKTHIKDIVMVCSNCHRMLHKKRPWLTKQKLQNLINRHKED